MPLKPQKNQASQKPCETHAKKSPGKLNSQTKLKQINTSWCPLHNDVIHLPKQNMQSCKSRKAKTFILSYQKLIHVYTFDQYAIQKSKAN